jgi:Fic family protein
LWHGLIAGAERLEDTPPLVQAAAVAFQFVFLHPFLDGNGRIHRFLLQDTLARRHLLPPGWLVPLSAEMLANPAAYDAALEAFSKPLLAQADYAIEHDRSLVLRNGDALLPFWRFPDLTQQVEYLHGVLERAIAAIPTEVAVLRHHDAARKAIGEIAAMPTRKLDLLLVLLRENSGKIPKRKRRLFSELSNGELARIEAAWAAPEEEVRW